MLPPEIAARLQSHALWDAAPEGGPRAYPVPEGQDRAVTETVAADVDVADEDKGGPEDDHANGVQ